jgi:hypothetical protein
MIELNFLNIAETLGLHDIRVTEAKEQVKMSRYTSALLPTASSPNHLSCLELTYMRQKSGVLFKAPVGSYFPPSTALP